MNVVSTKKNLTTARNSINFHGLRQLYLTWQTYMASANCT